MAIEEKKIVKIVLCKSNIFHHYINAILKLTENITFESTQIVINSLADQVLNRQKL